MPESKLFIIPAESSDLHRLDIQRILSTLTAYRTVPITVLLVTHLNVIHRHRNYLHDHLDLLFIQMTVCDVSSLVVQSLLKSRADTVHHHPEETDLLAAASHQHGLVLTAVALPAVLRRTSFVSAPTATELPHGRPIEDLQDEIGPDHHHHVVRARPDRVRETSSEGDVGHPSSRALGPL